MGKERGRVSNGGGRAGSGRGTLMSTGMLVWISCGSHPHASNWWVPRVITQIANPRVFHFTVKQSHVALELFTRSSVSHHSHSLEQRRTQANSHQKRRTGAIGPFNWDWLDGCKNGFAAWLSGNAGFSCFSRAGSVVGFSPSPFFHLASRPSTAAARSEHLVKHRRHLCSPSIKRRRRPPLHPSKPTAPV